MNLRFLQSGLIAAILLTGCATRPAGPGPSGSPPVAPSASVQEDARAPVAARFTFTEWDGPPVPVWYLRPDSAPSTATVVVVMHGMKRDAQRYLAAWADAARRHGLVVIAPAFTADSFPGAAGYNFGATRAVDGSEAPRSQWSYSAIEPIFDAVRIREGLSADRYWLFGHSAGAQFVHRLVMLGGAPRAAGAIAANAGSYTIATLEVAWPFGVRDAPGGRFDFARAFAAPLIVLLGGADTDPGHSSLPRQPQARAQGDHRLARGLSFYAEARRAAALLGERFEWACVIAPGVGHEQRRMAAFAARLILGPPPIPGSDCAPPAARGDASDAPVRPFSASAPRAASRHRTARGLPPFPSRLPRAA